MPVSYIIEEKLNYKTAKPTSCSSSDRKITVKASSRIKIIGPKREREKPASSDPSAG